MKISAAILVTSCKHGTDYGLYKNEVDAYEALYDYVCQFWEDSIEWAMPEDPDTAVQEYYEENGYNEWWEIVTRTFDLSGSAVRALLSNEEDIR